MSLLLVQNETAFLTPHQIVKELDKYIIGQEKAKRNVAIALRNRWRRMNTKKSIQSEIMPNNILMIGPTGVGKTEIARRLARLAHAPFIKVEASKFTEVGYVGRDVESIIRDLVEQAVSMIKKEKRAEVEEKAKDIVEEIILEILIPSIKKTNSSSSNEEQNKRTRDLFRKRIKNREIENKKIEIYIAASSSPNVGIMGGAIDEISIMNLENMLNRMMPKKRKKRRVTIKEAKKLLLDEEIEKLIDIEEIKGEAIRKTESSGIVFIDEIDKVVSSSYKDSSANISREGVQRDLLPIVEGSTVSTKYGTVSTSYILFIAAGAFHISKPSDLIPELQGRFPIRVELNSLSEKDFYQILKIPKNALSKQYEALFESEKVSMTFTEDALKQIAEVAFHINAEIENIGARRLHTVMSHLLNEFLFDVPDILKEGTNICVDLNMVKEKLESLYTNRDLTHYIL